MNKFVIENEELIYINMINDPSLKDFIIKALETYENEEEFREKLKDSNGVAEWLIFLLKNDKVLSEGANTYFVEILLASAFIHNIDYSYGEDDWPKIFNPRKKTEDIATKINLNGNTIDAIYQSVEGQLGKDNPNKLLHPNPNTPGSHFALACSIYYKKIKQK